VDDLEDEVAALTSKLSLSSTRIGLLERELEQRNRTISQKDDVIDERSRAQREQSDLLAQLAQEYNSLRDRQQTMEESVEAERASLRQSRREFEA
jgi:Mg2+ and Co2+ transporter CorA